MSIYYIADPHFGHERIIQLCDRPFASVDEMDEAMIRNWNDRVADDDTVCIVGDFWHNGKTQPNEILKRLSGKKYLIRGNHDRWMDGETAKLLAGQSNLMHIFDPSCGGHPVTVCHYPMLDWPGRDSYMVFGHIHNQENLPFSAYLNTEPRLLNAGVELNGYRPVTLAELIENNRQYKEQPVDMHMTTTIEEANHE